MILQNLGGYLVCLSMLQCACAERKFKKHETIGVEAIHGICIFLNYDFDCVFSHILREWNNISDLTRLLQKGVLRGGGGGRHVKRQCATVKFIEETPM
jgi:hypothetical protein